MAPGGTNELLFVPPGHPSHKNMDLYHRYFGRFVAGAKINQNAHRIFPERLVAMGRLNFSGPYAISPST